MKKLRTVQMMGILCLATSPTSWADSALTVYNQNFAVVREGISLELKPGVNQIRRTGITRQLEPDSVILRDPVGKHQLQILEQNYRADPITEDRLMTLYEGKVIKFEIKYADHIQTIMGKIIRSSEYGQQPIIEVEGELRFSLPGSPVFPALDDSSILKPTLHWLINTDAEGKMEAELAYITGGLNWSADYNIVAPEKGDVIDLIGWVTINNESGKSFEKARIKLMAGDVSKIQPIRKEYMKRARAMMAEAMEPAVTEKEFEEFHLYTLQRPTTLLDRQTKQVEFVRAGGVKSERLYIYDGAQISGRYGRMGMESIRNDPNYGTQSNKKVWIMREFVNSKDNNLGIPLPKGRLRFYRQDEDGQMEFTGENVIDHTPRDEKIRVYTGNAFDIVGERKRTDYQTRRDQRFVKETFEIKVRNHKKEAVEVRIVEHLYRWINWKIIEKSDPYIKTDSQTVEFRVKIPAGGEKTVSYTAHYTW